MRVVVFGATGMVGQGVLRECLLDPEVTAVLAVVRRSGSLGSAFTSDKLRELVWVDYYDFAGIESKIAGYDACFFCLGVSSFRMKEERYRRVTYDITMAAAKAMLRANPGRTTFVYVSGAGTDAKSGQMWARVKGETENALLGMGFKAVYMFRPGAIVPQHGITSKTMLYQVVYTVLAPVLPLMQRVFPRYVTTTEQVGSAMLRVAKRGYPKQVLEAVDIAEAGRA